MVNSIALIISAHNEELVLADTISSAIAQGQAPADIYVIADASNDATMKIAISMLGIMNVVSTTQRSKAKALQYGSSTFRLADRYDWIHVADADGTFGKDYFRTLRGTLTTNFAAATGYIRSREGSYISAFRVLEYTWGMEVIRRSQAWLKTIPVIPGPSSIFRSDVFAQLEWDNHSAAEDFDVTLQIYRKKLGQVQFIPQVKANTQDPLTFRDYVRQISRWNKGTFQSMRRHRIGLRPQMIDAYLGMQVLQSLFFIGMFAVALPIVAVVAGNPYFLAVAFLYDVGLTVLLSVFSSVRSRRKDVLINFPLVYGLKWVQAAIFLRYFVAIYVLGRYRGDVQWSDRAARYTSQQLAA